MTRDEIEHRRRCCHLKKHHYHSSHALDRLGFLVHVKLGEAVGHCCFVLKLPRHHLTCSLAIGSTIRPSVLHHPHLMEQERGKKEEGGLRKEKRSGNVVDPERKKIYPTILFGWAIHSLGDTWRGDKKKLCEFPNPFHQNTVVGVGWVGG